MGSLRKPQQNDMCCAGVPTYEIKVVADYLFIRELAPLALASNPMKSNPFQETFPEKKRRDSLKFWTSQGNCHDFTFSLFNFVAASKDECTQGCYFLLWDGLTLDGRSDKLLALSRWLLQWNKKKWAERKRRKCECLSYFRKEWALPPLHIFGTFLIMFYLSIYLFF